MLLVFRRKHNDVLRQASDFVDLFFNGDAGLQVFELNGAANFRENREGVRIPFGHLVAHLNGLAFLYEQARAVRNFVAFFLAALFVNDDNVTAAVHNHRGAAASADVFDIHVFCEACAACFEFRLFGHAACSSADVEGAHRKLSAGLADGLCSDNAHRFAHFHGASAGKVAAVTARANSTAAFASEHRANLDAHDAGRLNCAGQLLADFLINLDNDVALEVLDLIERNSANDAIAQRLNFFLALLENRLDVNSVGGAAVDFRDDYVLRHVHQTAGEVTGIGGLQCRVRQTLTSAVRGNEVLQHGEPFTEV